MSDVFENKYVKSIKDIEEKMSSGGDNFATSLAQDHQSIHKMAS